MAKLRVQPFEDMGDPAILVNADRDGMCLFQSAVRSAHECGEATFEFDAIKHHVVRQDGAADIEVGPQTVVSRFDDARLVEMLDLMIPLVGSGKPGHQYVDDLKSPMEILVLSVDEYKGPLITAIFPNFIRCHPLQTRCVSMNQRCAMDTTACDRYPQSEPDTAIVGPQAISAALS